MSFMLSPGVQVREIDLTTVVPGVATSEAAIAGAFRWGPVNKPVLVSNENDLAHHFGRPTNLNGETFFTAANFLSYSRSLYVSRAARTSGDSYNVVADLTSGSTTLTLDTPNINVVAGMALFGQGIEDGTTIVDDTDAATGVYIVSKAFNATVTGSAIQAFTADLAFNAIANTNNASLISHIVPSQDEFETAKDSFDPDVQWITRYPGAIGNTLDISVCETAEAFHNTINFTSLLGGNVTSIAMSIVSNESTATLTAGPGVTADGSATEAALTTILDDLSVGDYVRVVGDIGEEYLKVTSIGNVVREQEDDGVGGQQDSGISTAVVTFNQRLSSPTDVETTSLERFWEFFNLVEGAPGRTVYQTSRGNSAISDELHVVVIDRRGEIAGTPEEVVEVFEGLSRATDARGIDGEGLYFKDVINQSSRYVWAAGELPNSASNTALNLLDSTATTPYAQSFVGGRDTPNESTIALGDLYNAYLEGFQNVEEIDISLVLTGKARGGPHGEQLLNFLIDNLAHKRKDCVVFGSPDRNDVVGVTSPSVAVDRVNEFRNAVRSSSYGVLDSGYKYTYDKYNDVYRWVPLNGDTAGLCAYTDEVRDAWWSPAGFNRGHIRNIVRLSWNPNQSHRDALYKNGVNPVVNFPGQGTVLFGDKTLLAKPSAFDRINVRRLFIVLQKAISEASKFSLFEFNDEFTRASFVNLVTPFLRDVQGRRGITDFRVVCDESNNTGEVIDRNEFIGDIYIKPARSINFIRLNFVAVRTGVEFSEVVGQF